jgi:predicted DNA-binding transcriptional regulator AlpA
MTSKSKRLIPDSEVCRRYGVVAYTLWRWDHGKPSSGFPKPVRINGRKYRVEAELDQFDARRAAERDAHLDQRIQSDDQPLEAGEAASAGEGGFQVLPAET